jgi:hypothetical protein
MLLLLGSGTLVVLVGCVVLCVKEHPKQLMLAGSITTGGSLLVIPALATIAHFEPNVHDWTGFLFFIWLLTCVISPVVLLVGFLRYLLQLHRDHHS